MMRQLDSEVILYSDNQWNLLLRHQQVLPSKCRYLEGTLTLGDLMIAMFHQGAPFDSWQYDIVANLRDAICADCQQVNDVPCRLFLTPSRREEGEVADDLSFRDRSWRGVYGNRDFVLPQMWMDLGTPLLSEMNPPNPGLPPKTELLLQEAWPWKSDPRKRL